MAEKLDPKEVVTPEEITISNMWERGALVEVFRWKGVCTKQELLESPLTRTGDGANHRHLLGLLEGVRATPLKSTSPGSRGGKR